jgi:GT2 family glycosyltransferase
VEIRKSVSIVIPNYNCRHLLQEYLPFTYDAIKNANTVYEVIIVDDCSSDDSVEFIRSAYPEVILIVNSENQGFSYAFNKGIEAAQHELILLLNADVKLTPDYFEHQWKYFLAWNTFGVMSRIVDMEGDHIQDAAQVPKFNGLKLKTDYFYYSNSEDHRSLTFYLSRSNALINAQKLKSIGGFYELFSPFYCGDMELSIRAWRLDWQCYYEHKSVCRRQVSTSTENDQPTRWLKSTYYRNSFYVHTLHLNGLALIAWYFQITITDLIPKLLSGQAWIWKSYIELFKNWRLIMHYRYRINHLSNDNDIRISIFKVVKKIRNSVKNKRTIRFKP